MIAAVDSGGCSYRILKNAEELMSIRAPWDRLWAEAGAEYFLSFPACTRVGTGFIGRRGQYFGALLYVTNIG